MQATVNQMQDGLVVRDLLSDAVFAQRTLHGRNTATHTEAVYKLSHALAGLPDTILQELVNAAIEICGADSAGVSLQTSDGTDRVFFKWVATAGEYAKYLDAMLPEVPSACGICLERGRAQLITVSQRFFTHIGVEALEVTDGILLPWHAGEARGTIWILAHGRQEAFDHEDYRVMQLLAGLAAAGVRQQQQHAKEVARARAAGEAAMAVEMAEKLKRPLRTTQAIAYLAGRSKSDVEAKLLAEEMSMHLQELATTVKQMARKHPRKN